MSAPVPGAVPEYAVAWGKNYDPPQRPGWRLPDGSFYPAPQGDEHDDD